MSFLELHSGWGWGGCAAYSSLFSETSPSMTILWTSGTLSGLVITKTNGFLVPSLRIGPRMPPLSLKTSLTIRINPLSWKKKKFFLSMWLWWLRSSGSQSDGTSKSTSSWTPSFPYCSPSGWIYLSIFSCSHSDFKVKVSKQSNSSLIPKSDVFLAQAFSHLSLILLTFLLMTKRMACYFYLVIDKKLPSSVAEPQIWVTDQNHDPRPGPIA